MRVTLEESLTARVPVTLLSSEIRTVALAAVASMEATVPPVICSVPSTVIAPQEPLSTLSGLGALLLPPPTTTGTSLALPPDFPLSTNTTNGSESGAETRIILLPFWDVRL